MLTQLDLSSKISTQIYFTTGQDKETFVNKFISHIEKRKKIQEKLAQKNIMMLNKKQSVLSKITDCSLNPDQSFIYQTMKKELMQKGYIDFRYLGQGATGFVLLAKEKKTNRRYAIKGVHTKDQYGKVCEENQSQVQQEITMLNKCKGSPYVVNLLNTFVGKEYTYLVINECLGTLNEIIQMQDNRKLNELSAIKYCKDIAEGLYFVHQQGCIVNDLKMDNILIDYNGNAVVSDFGFADFLTKTSGYAINEYLGNFLFQAPECYSQENCPTYLKEYEKLGIKVQTKPTTKSEACSLGYLFYIMALGYDPQLILNKHLPLNFSEEFKKFIYYEQLKQMIEGLTKFNPKDRISVGDALITLKEIMSFEFQSDFSQNEMLDETTQAFLTQYLGNNVEFVQSYSGYYYPLFNDEQQALQEISKLQKPSNQAQQGENEQNGGQDIKNIKERIPIIYLASNLFYLASCGIDISLGFYGLQSFATMLAIIKITLIGGILHTFDSLDRLSPGPQFKHFRIAAKIAFGVFSLVQIASFGVAIGLAKA